MSKLSVSFFPGKSINSQKEFIEFYLDVAKTVSKKSKDDSSKVGAVIVSTDNSILSVGYNGFPRGFTRDDDPKYHERPLKYDYVIHAERNAIYNAVRSGVSLYNSMMFCTHPSCHDCTKAMINSGVTTMVWPKKQDESFIERTKDSFEIAKDMCKKIAYRFVYDSDSKKLDISPW